MATLSQRDIDRLEGKNNSIAETYPFYVASPELANSEPHGNLYKQHINFMLWSIGEDIHSNKILMWMINLYRSINNKTNTTFRKTISYLTLFRCLYVLVMFITSDITFSQISIAQEIKLNEETIPKLTEQDLLNTLDFLKNIPYESKMIYNNIYVDESANIPELLNQLLSNIQRLQAYYDRNSR